MQTRRSFLAFAAAGQLLSPLARAMRVADSRSIVARLPEVLLQTHAGRDVYFYNDVMSGRLAILNLQYGDTSRLQLPPARQSPGAGLCAHYVYSVSLQPARASTADLRRYMDQYGRGEAWPPADCALLRLRLGMVNGA